MGFHVETGQGVIGCDSGDGVFVHLPPIQANVFKGHNKGDCSEFGVPEGYRAREAAMVEAHRHGTRIHGPLPQIPALSPARSRSRCMLFRPGKRPRYRITTDGCPLVTFERIIDGTDPARGSAVWLMDKTAFFLCVFARYGAGATVSSRGLGR